MLLMENNDVQIPRKIFVGDIVLLAVGCNLRNFFVCHHKKNVFCEGSPEVLGFNDGHHRRLMWITLSDVMSKLTILQN